MADILDEIRDAYEYDTNGWFAIRREAAIDMRYVGGNPWTAKDEKQRKDRPTVAPEEIGQYFNQVINQLRANPRGMKFAPVGNGANDAGARFYQNKAREIEYRSHAKIAYITAAENAIQRGYGFVRVTTRYASPRDANQDIWIEDFPNPDMVLPDCDAKRPDSSDQRRCTVFQWMPQSEFRRQYPTAEITNFSDWQGRYPLWIKGQKVLVAEYWTITTTKQQLLLVQGADGRQTQAFKDEVPGAQVLRELRMVDVPAVKMYLTNGLEILHQQDWPGKYIPIVSCYGKVLYTEGEEGMEKQILSMTRFGRDPWKAYCYACSQELEVLAMVPKAPLMIGKGQMDATQLNEVARSLHEPVAALTYNLTTPETGQQILGAPGPVEYQTGQHLQALELVKEGFRRAIQSAMGSNFLPTQAQRRNEKSGVALDKIGQAAATGTFHFVDHYDDLIRQVGVIIEDLAPHVYDYAGETGTMEADGTAKRVPINGGHPEAISTQGDYLVTVSTGPSSDSERDAAKDFTDTLVSNIGMIAQVSGPKAAAAVLAQSIRMQNLGPTGDQLADIVEPPEFKKQDGQQPPNPREMALQQQLQMATQKVQELGRAVETDQIKTQGQVQIKQMDLAFQREKLQRDAETKISVAELGAKVDRLTLFLEERARLGMQDQQAVQAAHDRAHDVALSAMNHQQDLEQGEQDHQQSLEQGEQAQQGVLASQANQAALAPPQTGAPA